MVNKEKLVFVLLFVSLVFVSLAIGSRNRDKSSARLTKPNIIGDIKYLQVNNISLPFGNDGVIADVGDGIAGPLHGNGGEFPAGSDLGFLFSSGFFISGFVDGELWAAAVASASRIQDYEPGTFRGDPTAPEFKIYEIRSTDGPDSESGAFQDWADAVQLGADFVDVDGDGAYNPNVDRPDLIGDQMFWYTITDGVSPGDRSWAGARVIGVDIHVTAWAFARGGELGNMIFVRFRILNKSDKRIDDMYFSSWHDPDLGDYTDDLVGCDPEFSRGFTYNDGTDDGDDGYGPNPPCFMVDFFQGPIQPSPGDTALRVLGPNLGVERIPDFRNVPMSSFTQYIQSDPQLGDPDTQQEGRNYMTGLNQQGDIFDPLVQGVGGTAEDDVNFWYSGDPVTGTGWRQSFASDQRMLLNTGPFFMDPGDEQDIVTAFIVGQGDDALSSVSAARAIDELAQSVYDNNFDVAGPPPKVDLTVRSTTNADGDVVIDLLWPTAEQVTDRQVKAGSDQRFEGFAARQFRTPSSVAEVSGIENLKVLARFDLDNELGDLYSDLSEGRVLVFPALGNLDSLALSDSLTGFLQLSLTTDAFTGRPFRVGTPYYFGVTAYSVDHNAFKPNENTFDENDIVGFSPSTYLENTQDVVEIISGERVNVDIAVGREAERASGVSDAMVLWEVIETDQVTGDEYEVNFAKDENDQLTWNFVNVTQNTTLLANQTNFSGLFENPVVEGLMVRPTNVDVGINSWSYEPAANNWINLETANALFDFNVGPFGYIGNDSPDDLNQFRTTAIKATDMRRIELRFGETQLAYRYINGPVFLRTWRWAGSLDVADTTGRGIQEIGKFGEGFVEVPFQAWSVDDRFNEERQLSIGFLEQANDTPDGIWFPGTDATNQEYIFIFNSDYDATGNQPQYQPPRPFGIQRGFTLAEGTDEEKAIAKSSLFDALYIGAFQSNTDAAGEALFFASGDKITLIPNYVATENDRFHIQTIAATNEATQSLQASNFENVNVFPNPYLASNSLESPRFPEESFVTFTNLPQTVNIKIYTISGKLVRELDESNKESEESAFLRWDLKNAFDLKVASGVYLVHLEAPELNMQKLLKLAIIQRESRLQKF